MENQKQMPILPVDKQEADSLNQLVSKLEEISKNKKMPEQSAETIADDFDATPEQLKLIEGAEEDMRELLGLMGINYDNLIAMDGKSVYSRAVSANPGILQHVKTARNPVLEAVKISLKFKPYAEFMEKYGNEPDEILKNIQAEMAEQKNNQSSSENMKKSQEEEVFKGSAFSNNPSTKTAKKEAVMPSLDDIFKR